MNHELFGLIINLVPPVLGLGLYFWLCTKMKAQRFSIWLQFAYFQIFFIYGGLLMVALTTIFWEWSGMASLGCLFLLVPAPLIMIVQTAKIWSFRKRSRFHATAFWLSAVYAPLVATVIIWRVLDPPIGT